MQIGNFIHYLITFVGGLIVGFTNEWRIAIVTLAVIPFIVLAGGFYIYSLTKFTATAASAYSEAGSMVEQVSFFNKTWTCYFQ
jgi:ATP-binding cassette subfamily B (MDR/TAP) protein 1